MFLRVIEAPFVLLIRVALSIANFADDWRRRVLWRARRLRGSLRKLRERWLRSVGRHERAWFSRPSWNRTPPAIEDKIVRLHVEQPQLGAGQLRHLVFRVLAFSTTRETIRRILLRNQNLIVKLEEEKRKPPRKIEVSASRVLWGADLTLLWILGFFPVWVLGVVDYHGSRLVALEPLARPSAAAVTNAMRDAFERDGSPERIITDNGGVFRSEAFERMLASRGVVHTFTRPCHPWTNGRIERVFRTLKETIRTCFWLLRSRDHVVRVCADFVSFYNARPHQSFGGRTPDEVHANRPLHSGFISRVSYFDGRLLWYRFT